MDIFERASRNKLRFTTVSGLLNTEDLWSLPLTGGRVCLDDIAKAIYKELKQYDVSFVSSTEPSNTILNLQFDIVKHVIKVKLAAKESASIACKARDREQKILAIIEDKQDQDLRSLDIEELKKLITQD